MYDNPEISSVSCVDVLCRTSSIRVTNRALFPSRLTDLGPPLLPLPSRGIDIDAGIC
jgi:hypothetical protein